MADALENESSGLSVEDQLEQFLAKDDALRDPSTGEYRPAYADGSTPFTAINKSPVDPMDRLKLGVGNPEGQFKYLKSKFEDVVADPETNEFSVKKDGLWYTVDPKGLGEGDAWAKSQELIKDAADIATEATMVGAAAGTAAATGGASLIAQGAAQGAMAAGITGIKTSLGRMAGTYEATPEEEIKDIALETVFGFGGEFFLPGVKYVGKPFAKKFAKGMRSVGKTASDTTKNLIAEVFGNTSGAGAGNMRRAFDRAPQIAKHIGDLGERFASHEDVVSEGTRMQINQMGEFAQRTRGALSKYYTESMKPMMKQIPSNFNSNTKGFVGDLLKQASDIGLGSIDDQGKFAMRSVDEIVAVLNASGDPNLMSAAADLSSDKKNVKLLESYLNSLQSQMKSRSLAGPKGFQQLIELDKLNTKLAHDVSQKLYKNNAGGAAQLVNGLKASWSENFDNRMVSQLGSTKLAGRYAEMKSQYSKMASEASEILDTHAKAVATGNEKLYENTLRKVISQEGKNETVKMGFDRVINNLGKIDSKLQGIYDNVLDIEAAKAFTPTVRGSFIQFGFLAAMFSGQVDDIAKIAAGTSPRLTFMAVDQLQKSAQFMSNLAGMSPRAKQMSVKVGHATKELVREQAERGRLSDLLGNDAAMDALVLGSLRAGKEINDAEQAILGEGQ